ncbi:MAG: DUF364 domain-containing protein [Termitinemataceae bacterium]|nr:MAG: DUF364 domain-containing protein [Termitinemataceae bacterium]
MWEIYDTLIEGIPETITVEESVLGDHWAALRSSEDGAGLGMRYNITTINSDLPEDLRGIKLCRLARAAKSWNFIEAAFGVAAINSYYNHHERAKKLGIDISASSRANEAFLKYRDMLTGKNVAVVGHFPYLENLLKPVCNLSIIERQPQEGDYPDAASEYLLPLQDYVFITGSTLVNKTLPRLLQICAKRRVVLVGPSTPLAPALFNFGIYDLSGFVVRDRPALLSAIREPANDGNYGRHFEAGVMVNFKADS